VRDYDEDDDDDDDDDDVAVDDDDADDADDVTLNAHVGNPCYLSQRFLSQGRGQTDSCTHAARNFGGSVCSMDLGIISRRLSAASRGGE